ncbi:MAG: tetratricopeptide repeat protein, partial [Caldimonas sp.]
VNVTLGQRRMDPSTNRDPAQITVDFLPPEDLRGMRTHDIGEQTVLAMYANNRAAEALTQGRLDDAYAWTRASLRNDASFTSAYNTLGVVYLRHGNRAEAERAFQRVLAASPTHAPALANLVVLYEQAGRTDAASEMRDRLARVEPTPPFHDFNLGKAAMERGEVAQARALFAREVARADYNHEFHFWLGLAEWRLGHADIARRELERARDSSPSRGQHALYAAKLAWLQSQAQATTPR